MYKVEYSYATRIDTKKNGRTNINKDYKTGDFEIF